jgi:hypothetical protein
MSTYLDDIIAEANRKAAAGELPPTSPQATPATVLPDSVAARIAEAQRIEADAAQKAQLDHHATVLLLNSGEFTVNDLSLLSPDERIEKAGLVETPDYGQPAVYGQADIDYLTEALGEGEQS